MRVKRNILICLIGLLCLVSVDSYVKKSHSDPEQNATASPVLSTENSEMESKQQHSFSKTIPELVLVNKSVRLERAYEPTDLRQIQGVYLREMAAVALQEMLTGGEKEGIHGLVPFSACRSYGTQAAVYSNKIASLRPKYHEEAEEIALRLVAPPGGSEQQTGMAIDITLKDFLDYEYVLNYEFADTIQGKWLSKNSWKYGFILRYNENKEGITNFSYEPWHFRYVGREHAKVMYELDLCLEEYIGMFGI